MADQPEDQWAIIARKISSTHYGPSKAVELERRCPNVSYASRLKRTLSRRDISSKVDWTGSEYEMPALKCHDLLLGKKRTPDPAEVLRKVQFKAGEKARKQHDRKVDRMYQMAMTYAATTTRILEKHGEFTNVWDGAYLRDIRESFCGKRDSVATKAPPKKKEISKQRLTDAQSPYTFLREASTPPSSAGRFNRQLPPISPKDDNKHLVKPAKTKKKKQQAKIEEPRPILPLSYGEVLASEKTIEATYKKTFWTNYYNNTTKEDVTTAA